MSENGNVNKAFDSEHDSIEIKSYVEKGNGSIKNRFEVTEVKLDGSEAEVNRKDERAQWGNGLEFLMSCIAMSVGLGNIWRFPFTAYENGGGAFLIPYLIVLVVVGRPIYYLEMCLGQFTSRANVKTFEALAPAVKGMGYGQLLGTICVATYYCCLMALTLFYMIHSFTSVLPWSECLPEWSAMNISCIPSKEVGTGTNLNTSISSSELWFTRVVLKEKLYIDDGIGWPEWKLTLCLLLSWFITFLVTRNGVQSSGKASYFLAIFPYIILFALLIRSCTLEGSAKGILYFIQPKWEMLYEAKVWYSAVSQCFFSLNVGFGTITMYASYNSFEHNVYRDALIVTTMDTFTSLLAGTAIFGILGNLAYKLNVDVGDVIKSGGAGLAFISYPEAIAKFEDVPWLFSIMFFFMLFVLGVGSLVALQGGAFTVVMDSFPHLKIWHISGGVAIGCFLIGLVYVTPGGQFILTMVDHFGGTFIFFILTTIEVIIVFWWYGLDNFCLDIEYMLKRKVGWYWRISWGVITPIVLATILFYFIATLDRLKYNSYDFPDKALVFGWMILIIGVLQPLLWWAVYIYQNRNLGVRKAYEDSVSHARWGPKDPVRYQEWKEFKVKAEAERLARNRTWLQRKKDLLFGY